MDIREEYKTICFALSEKEKEIETFRADIFTFNPEIGKVLEEWTILKKRKEELEAKIKND